MAFWCNVDQLQNDPTKLHDHFNNGHSTSVTWISQIYFLVEVRSFSLNIVICLLFYLSTHLDEPLVDNSNYFSIDDNLNITHQFIEKVVITQRGRFYISFNCFQLCLK